MIGTALCIELMRRRYEITGVDRIPNKWDSGVDQHTILSDIVSWRYNKLSELVPRFDLIIHLAANARVYKLVKYPMLARDNFEMIFNVLEFARKMQCIPIIFASSREVYGPCVVPVSEEGIYVDRSENPYAATKLAAEALIHAYHKCYNLNYIILRLSNVYGKYDDSDRVIPTWIKATRRNEDLIVYGREKAYDFTYIDDCVDAILRCVEQFDNVKNDTFNIASGEMTVLVDIAKIIQQDTNAEGSIIEKKNRIGEILSYQADINHASLKLGYEPKVGIEEGIKKTVRWYGAANAKNWKGSIVR